MKLEGRTLHQPLAAPRRRGAGGGAGKVGGAVRRSQQAAGERRPGSACPAVLPGAPTSMAALPRART